MVNKNAALALLNAELVLKIDEIVCLCESYGYKVTPTVVLRHSDGASSSTMIGKDPIELVMSCLAELDEIAIHSELSAKEAALRLLKQVRGNDG